MADLLLDVSAITKTYRFGRLLFGSRLTAVDHVSVSLPASPPSILGVVGESGSGKTTLARMVLGLVPPSGGRVLVGGQDASRIRGRTERLRFRRTVQPIFQNPYDSFSAFRPVVSYLYDTAVNLGLARDRKEAGGIVDETLSAVGLDLASVSGKYPNQFSGGELQRIAIGRALIPRPAIIVADEPVGMIDASLRMNIVNLFASLKERHGVSIVYITHDLSTADYLSDSVMIMFAGRVMESGPARAVLAEPRHPYTALLLRSVPQVGAPWGGTPPASEAGAAADGCPFAARCPHADERCRTDRPPLEQIGEGRAVACLRHRDIEP